MILLEGANPNRKATPMPFPALSKNPSVLSPYSAVTALPSTLALKLEDIVISLNNSIVPLQRNHNL
jgi:hypothetical protein